MLGLSRHNKYTLTGTIRTRTVFFLLPSWTLRRRPSFFLQVFTSLLLDDTHNMMPIVSWCNIRTWVKSWLHHLPITWLKHCYQWSPVNWVDIFYLIFFLVYIKCNRYTYSTERSSWYKVNYYFQFFLSELAEHFRRYNIEPLVNCQCVFSLSFHTHNELNSEHRSKQWGW